MPGGDDIDGLSSQGRAIGRMLGAFGGEAPREGIVREAVRSQGHGPEFADGLMRDADQSRDTSGRVSAEQGMCPISHALELLEVVRQVATKRITFIHDL